MKFVALVSGGKDSCYNILHCLKNGHELVALANLYPDHESIQELDSFMFQTVGHHIVSLYGKCTGLPLFRRKIRINGSKNTDLNYTPTVGDEIEDLYEILREVKLKIPSVEAVSVGAILSSYQRTRVESVSNRLGLQTLSYLWQRNQMELMQEMCQVSKIAENYDNSLDCSMHALIIKVAAVGLDQKHLGLSLPEIFPTLMKLNKMYDVHICGEGGEYETMVLDAPFFTKGRLRLLKITKGNGDINDGVHNAVLSVEFEPRLIQQSEMLDKISQTIQPPLFNDSWKAFIKGCESLLCNKTDAIPANTFSVCSSECLQNTNEVRSGYLYINNLVASQESRKNLLEETLSILNQLLIILERYSVTMSQVLKTTLVLSDMSFFSQVNTLYNEYFKVSECGPLPPARACVEVSDLKKLNYRISLSVVASISEKSELIDPSKYPVNSNKNGLHVQGRSYWAPCNIGPYSQALWLNSDVNSICHISGQIALNPCSMQLPLDLVPLNECILALKHYETINKCIASSTQLMVCCYITNSAWLKYVAAVWRNYNGSPPGDDSLGVCLTQLIIVEVTALPKGARFEWEGTSCKIKEAVGDSDDDEIDVTMRNVNDSHDEVVDNDVLHFSTDNTISVTNGDGMRTYCTIFYDEYDELYKLFTGLRACHFIVYCNMSDWTTLNSVSSNIKLDFRPCVNVYDYSGRLYKYGVQIVCA